MAKNILSKLTTWLKADVAAATGGGKTPEAKVESTLEAKAPTQGRKTAALETVPISGGPASALFHDLGYSVIVPKKNEQNATASVDDSWTAAAPAGMRLKRFRLDIDGTYTYAGGGGAWLNNVVGTMSLVVDGINAFYGTGYINSQWLTRGAIIAQAAGARRANAPGSAQGGAMFNDAQLATTVATSGFWEFTLPVTAKSGSYTVNITFNSATAINAVATAGSCNVGVTFIFMAEGQTDTEKPFTLAIKATNNASNLIANNCVAYGVGSVNNDLGTTGGGVGIVTAYTFGVLGYTANQLSIHEDYDAAFFGTPARSTEAYHGAPLPTDPSTGNPLYAIIDSQPEPSTVSVTLGGQYAVVQIAYGQSDAASLLSIQGQG